MSKLKIYNRIISLLLAGFVLVGGAKAAKADTVTANRELDSKGIVYRPKDSAATNLVANAEGVLSSTIENGQLPEEYNGMVLNETLIIDSLNQMRENLLNYNFRTLILDFENFDYLSMAIYMDNETEKQILNKVKDLINTFVKDQSNLEVLSRLIGIFQGNDKELSTALLSVGGKQALANDVYFLAALAQTLGLDGSYVTALEELVWAYGNNGDIITYLKTIIKTTAIGNLIMQEVKNNPKLVGNSPYTIKPGYTIATERPNKSYNPGNIRGI